jgi:hypothetical protein
MKYSVAAALAIALILPIGPAHSGDAEDALNAAGSFNSEFDANHMNQLYSDFAGQLVRGMVTKDAFVSQMAVYRSNLGGGAVSRETIQKQTAASPTGQSMFSIRYKATFPATAVYEDLTLIKENPGGWKLYGIYFNAIPAN